jgi:hypothetical protein
MEGSHKRKQNKQKKTTKQIDVPTHFSVITLRCEMSLLILREEQRLRVLRRGC